MGNSCFPHKVDQLPPKFTRHNSRNSSTTPHSPSRSVVSRTRGSVVEGNGDSGRSIGTFNTIDTQHHDLTDLLQDMLTSYFEHLSHHDMNIDVLNYIVELESLQDVNDPDYKRELQEELFHAVKKEFMMILKNDPNKVSSIVSGDFTEPNTTELRDVPELTTTPPDMRHHSLVSAGTSGRSQWEAEEARRRDAAAREFVLALRQTTTEGQGSETCTSNKTITVSQVRAAAAKAVAAFNNN